jgi:tetratricopeptide (TPR) repeat protein
MIDKDATHKEIIGMMYKNPDGALERANVLVAEMPNEIWALWVRSGVHKARSDIDKAFADLNAAIKIKEDEPAHYFKRANIFLEIEDYENAIVEYSKCIYFGKQLQFSYFHASCKFERAYCYCRLGDFDAAKLDLVGLDDDMCNWFDRLRTKADMLRACENRRLD